MPYTDYLDTPHWKHVRELAIVRAAYRCQVCNAAGRLEVHHRTYERRGFEALEDLTVLCGGPEGCHSLFHDAGRLPIAEAA